MPLSVPVARCSGSGMGIGRIGRGIGVATQRRA